MVEQVFIVPFDKTLDVENGFTRQKHYKEIWSKYNDIGKYVDKEVAEKTTVMQQVVPYIIIKSNRGNYFTSNLHVNHIKITSIGFGNHIAPIDGTTQPLFRGAARTLFNDISLEQYNNAMTYVGTVRDLKNNSKHLGYVFLIQDIEEDSIKLLNESESYFGKWLSKQELINGYSKLEPWSKHIINYLVDNEF